jgi:hypothetical protein
MKTSKFAYAAIVFVPGAAFAAGAFDGTWKVDMNHVQSSKKPFVYVIGGGSYTCSSCAPAYTVKADGKDQPVTGHDFDTAAVTVTPTSVTVVAKLKGKTLSSDKTEVSADGKTATVNVSYYSGAEPVAVKVILTNVAPPAAGDNALSGSWVESKVVSVSDAGAVVTYQITDDGFTMSGNGQSYSAKFDGKKYPITGDPTNTMVKLKRVSPTEVVESDYSKGKLVETTQMTVSADGKTLRVSDTQVLAGRTMRYTMTRQP